jgi:serine phosphatase RsbU (regulator of sigma subunit)
MHERLTDAGAAFRELLRGLHLSTGEDLPEVLESVGDLLGVAIRAVYLVDYRQDVLRPIERAAAGENGALAIDTTLAGRAFREVVQVPVGPGPDSLWVPVIDGTERLGVLDVAAADGDLRDKEVQENLRWLANLVGHIIGAKRTYGRVLEVTRRTEPMSLAAEVLWRLLPPLTAAVEGLSISAVLEPCYNVGGDCFDYGLDGEVARFCVLDAMGHSLPAGLLSTVALAAYRSSRNAGVSLAEAGHAVDTALRDHVGGDRFVTGALCDLDIRTGRLSYLVAGHPPPLVLRAGTLVRQLDQSGGVPFGLPADIGPRATVRHEQLRPGDEILVYTDGVTEARDGDGQLFGLPRLIDVAERETATRRPRPEVLRRLAHAIRAHQHGALKDDATVLLVEWKTGGEHRVTPAPPGTIGGDR